MAFMTIVIGALQAAATAVAVKTAIDGLKEGDLSKAVLGGIGAFAGVQGLSSTMTSATQTVNAAAQPTLDAAASSSGVGAGIAENQITGNIADWGASAVAANPLGMNLAQFPGAFAPTTEGMLSGASNMAGAANTLGAANPLALANTSATIPPTSAAIPTASNSIATAPVTGAPATAADKFLATQAGSNPNVNIFESVSDGVNRMMGSGTPATNTPTGVQAAPASTPSNMLSDISKYFKDNQHLVGGLLQLSAGNAQQDFVERQLEENRRRDAASRARRATTPTSNYMYGLPPGLLG